MPMSPPAYTHTHTHASPHFLSNSPFGYENIFFWKYALKYCFRKFHKWNNHSVLFSFCLTLHFPNQSGHGTFSILSLSVPHQPHFWKCFIGTSFAILTFPQWTSRVSLTKELFQTTCEPVFLMATSGGGGSGGRGNSSWPFKTCIFYKGTFIICCPAC